jgi:NAD(P)-dependent dehydrogenase (short-subunit alcohol dehydrogenase family)
MPGAWLAAGMHSNEARSTKIAVVTGASSGIGRQAAIRIADAFARQVTETIGERWDRTTFDHLVNNAGFGQMAMLEDTTTEELFDQFHRVILKGPTS